MRLLITAVALIAFHVSYSQDTLSIFTKTVSVPGKTKDQLYRNALNLRIGIFDSCQMVLPETGQANKILIFQYCKTGFPFYISETKMYHFAKLSCDLTMEVKEESYSYTFRIVSQILITRVPYSNQQYTDVLPIKNLIPDLESIANSWGSRVKKSDLPNAIDAYWRWRRDKEDKIQTLLGL